MLTFNVQVRAANFLSWFTPIARPALEIAGRTLVRAIQVKINKSYPPASKPGNPPARRTGRLHSSIGFVVNGLSVIVSAKVPYAAFLEDGTGRMAARPFMAKTLNESWSVVWGVMTSTRA